MNSFEKRPAVFVDIPLGSRPGTIGSHMSLAGTEPRPQSAWSNRVVNSPRASAETVASYLGTKPARLFRHRRHRHKGQAALSPESTNTPTTTATATFGPNAGAAGGFGSGAAGGGLAPGVGARKGPPSGSTGETEVSYPATLAEIERWLDDVVATALKTPPPQDTHSSSVCLLFLDEDKCARAFGDEFGLSRLYARLKITDWRPSHFQSTFCRFAVPLDVDIIEPPHSDGKDKDGVATPTTAPSKSAAAAATAAAHNSPHHNWDWRFSISHPFEWDLLWAYFPSSRTTVGIARTWIEGYTTDFIEIESAVQSFPAPTLAHPMLLGLFALDILTRDTMVSVRTKGEQLWQAQKVTGYNHFPHQENKRLVLDEDDTRLAQDIGTMTGVVMGAGINLTAWIHVAQQLVGFSKFVCEQDARFGKSHFVTGAEHRGQDHVRYERMSQYVVQLAEKQVGDLDGAHYDASSWINTASFLLQGVLNLAAQRDSAINIQLARDSKKIAEDSKRDSTSMMSLAIVTMFFLPGTYTATLFAMPLFEDISRASNSYTMWLYWLLTIALTLSVFLSWHLWVRHKYKTPKAKVDKSMT